MNTPPPKPLADIQSWPLFAQKDGSYNYLIGSLSADRYLVADARRRPLVERIIRRLQEGASIPHIQEELAREGIRTDVRSFVEKLEQYGLLEAPEQEAAPQAARQPFYSQLKVLSWDVMDIPLSGWWPHLRGFSRRFRPVFLLLTAASTLLVLGLLALSGGLSVLRQVFQARGDLNWAFLTLTYLSTLFVAIPLHELAHAFFATEQGVFPRRLTVRLYMMVLPFFSLQLPGLYTLPLRSRLASIAAGPLMNLLVGNAALLAAWPGLGSPAPLHAVLMAFAAINYATFLINLTPFLPLDGYHLLSQWGFRELDIRSKAWASVRRWFQERSNRVPAGHAALAALDSAFITALLYLIIRQLNAYITRWVQQALPAAPHLAGLVLLAADICIIGFAIHRLTTLMGIRQAIKKTL